MTRPAIAQRFGRIMYRRQRLISGVPHPVVSSPAIVRLPARQSARSAALKQGKSRTARNLIKKPKDNHIRFHTTLHYGEDTVFNLESRYVRHLAILLKYRCYVLLALETLNFSLLRRLQLLRGVKTIS